MKLASHCRLIPTGPLSRAGIVAALFITAAPVHAGPIRTVEPVTVAGVGVALTAVGMVTNWIEKNSDDVKAAASALTSGDHQGHSDFKSDSGYSTAGLVAAKVDDLHGYVSTFSSAHEGFFGTTISGASYNPYAFGFLNPLEKKPDKHHIEGAAQASIDGHVEGKGITEGRQGTPFAVGDPTAVNFNVFLDTENFLLSQPTDLAANASSSVSWEFSQSIDGVERFFTSIYLNNLGKLVFNYHTGVAGFAPEVFQFIVTDDGYEVTPISNYSENGKDYYVQTFYTDMINPTGIAADAPLFAYDLSGAARMAANATAAVPEPSDWALSAIGLFGIGAVMRRRRQT